MLADPVDLKSMPRRKVVILEADLLFELSDFLGKKLDGTPALRANHVVVAAAIVLMLVAGDAVVEGNFAGQAAFRQQFQRAVDRGVADAGVFLLHQAVEFVGGEVVASLQERAQDSIALASLLQADALPSAGEGSPGLRAPSGGRCGGLVIDAILQHGRRD